MLSRRTDGFGIGSVRDDQVSDFASFLIIDNLAVTDGDRPNGIDTAAGHPHVDGPFAVGETDREIAECVGHARPANRSVVSPGHGNGDLAQRLAGVGLDPSDQDIAQFGRQRSAWQINRAKRFAAVRGGIV